MLDHFEVPDNQTRLLALEKGEIDLVFGKNMIDGVAVKKFSNMKGYMLEPRLLIADEPTTALDAFTQFEVLKISHGKLCEIGSFVVCGDV